MKVALDTSVVVAAIVAGHAHRARAWPWLQAARSGRIEAALSAHAVAEAWVTLTALPVEPRVAPDTARRLLQRLCRTVAPVAIAWDVYEAAVERCCDAGRPSGAVYDALHLITAERWGAKLFLTFNERHFLPLAAAGGPTILVPPDPNGLGDWVR